MTFHITVESLKKDLVIQKLPVGKFIAALRVLKNIPRHLSGFTELDENKIIEALPEMLTSSYEEIASIVEIATELTREEVDGLFADELIEIAAKIIQSNEFDKLGDSVKKNFGNLKLPNVKKK